MKAVRHDESRLRLKPAQRARLLKLASDRTASRKDRKWAKWQLAEIDADARPAAIKKQAGRRATGAGVPVINVRRSARPSASRAVKSVLVDEGLPARAPVDNTVFTRIRARRERLVLPNGESVRELVTGGRRI